MINTYAIQTIFLYFFNSFLSVLFFISSNKKWNNTKRKKLIMINAAIKKLFSMPNLSFINAQMIIVKQPYPNNLGAWYNSSFATWKSLSLLYAINLDVYHVTMAQNNSPIKKSNPVFLESRPVMIISIPWSVLLKKKYAMRRKRIPGKNTQNTCKKMASLWSALLMLCNNSLFVLWNYNNVIVEFICIYIKQ